MVPVISLFVQCICLCCIWLVHIASCECAVSSYFCILFAFLRSFCWGCEYLSSALSPGDESEMWIFQVWCKACFAFSSCPNNGFLTSCRALFKSNIHLSLCAFLALFHFLCACLFMFQSASVCYVPSSLHSAQFCDRREPKGEVVRADSEWQTMISRPSAVWSKRTGRDDLRQRL